MVWLATIDPHRVVDDGSPALDDTDHLTVRVAAPPEDETRAPTIQRIDDRVVDEGVQSTWQAKAADPDGDGVSFAVSSGPPGLAVTSSGKVTWTPTEAQGPGSYPVTLRATDDGSPALSSETTFTVGVREVNRPPRLASLPDVLLDVGATLEVTAAATKFLTSPPTP